MARLRVIADDLTGAADAAVAFVRSHDFVRVMLANDGLAASDDGAAVAAIDTAARDATEHQLSDALRAGFSHLAADEEVVVKIDSLLRGHVTRFVATARAVLPERLVVVAPAFPAVGRTTRDGIQRADRQPVRDGPGGAIGALLSPLPTVAVGLRQIRGEGRVLTGRLGEIHDAGRIAVCDAETDADLDALVAARASVSGATTWVGSGGISRALARRAEPVRPTRRATRPVGRGASRFLAVIGSTSEVARSQVASLATRAHVIEVPVGAVDDTVAARLRAEITRRARDEDLIVTIAAGSDPRAATSITRPLAIACTEAANAGALLLLSGGATARAVLERCGVTELDVEFELEPGVVVLRAPGRPATIVTKAGSFGDADTFTRVVDALTSRDR